MLHLNVRQADIICPAVRPNGIAAPEDQNEPLIRLEKRGDSCIGQEGTCDNGPTGFLAFLLKKTKYAKSERIHLP
jgi:hypothetical protein